MKLKELKVRIEKDIPFGTDNNFELFGIAHQLNTQIQKLSTVNEKLTDTL